MTVAWAQPCGHTQQDKQECKRPREDCANTVCRARMPASHCSVRAANTHPGQTRASHVLEQKTRISRCGSVRPPQAHCPYFQNASDLPSSRAHGALSTCSSHSVFLRASSLFLHSLPNPHEHLSHCSRYALRPAPSRLEAPGEQGAFLTYLLFLIPGMRPSLRQVTTNT